MLKETIYKEMQLADRLNVAFPDKRIPDGFIDKSKTRVGITYMNFHDKRNTLTIITSEPIIQEALDHYPYLNLFDVRAGVTPQMIAEYLRSDAEYKRLVTTPESFGKIITAASSMNKLQWLYDGFFLYLDEIHGYATDAFREDILIPFDFEMEYVWKFKHMAMGSATPFKCSDPRVAELQHYKLVYKEKFGTINIVYDVNPKASLHYVLTHPEVFPGNVHIFFNTVTEMGEAIRNAGISNVNIYCRDDERNMTKLEEEKQYFKSKPIADEYKKFNFYSCRYNDGWDLKDNETATIILVTDISIPHSLIGIPYKGFQAVGRLKVNPYKIYHITNSYGKAAMRSLETIQQKWLYNAAKQINYYNNHVADCGRDGIEDNGLLGELVKPFSGFIGQEAKLYYSKLDQLICAEYCKEHYNSIDTIRQTWESLNYNATLEQFEPTAIVRIKRTKQEINQQVIERFEEFTKFPERYRYEVISATLNKYQTEFYQLWLAYTILGPDEIARLNYNDNQLKKALIETSNKNAETKLRMMLIDEFKLNKRYTNKYVKAKLQEFYNELRIQNPNGTTKTATASQLAEFGLFMVHECKTEDEHGQIKPGLEIIKINYSLKVAA